ncbi:MAG: metallophosphoesterase [Deltaproteobacteria bacterium]|nr:metallophosphoesterase [Deltaproteobacteria bacterium]
MRFLHFSDIHLEQGFKEVSSRKFFNKRFIGWMNLRLRRAKHYREAPAKVRALADLVEAEGIDVALCSGDYTALGTEPEIAYARKAIEPIREAATGFVTVPGNHDVYLPDALGVFENHFADVLATDLPELVRDEVWPQVRLFGDHVAVITVNSARPNPPIMRSSGRIPDAQMDGLKDALAHPKVAGRFVFVMTHYAPRLKSGRPDTPNHGLENADELLAICGSVERGAIVHGHVHKCYSVTVPETSMTLFGAGSTTQEGAEGLWVYDVSPDGAFARRGHWDGERYAIGDERVEL